MRILGLFWCAMAMAAVGLAQQAAIIGPTDSIAFDYSNADFATWQVTRFEASWDNAAFALVGLQAVTLNDTPSGFTTYLASPPFSSGTHTVSFRACNAQGCGGASAPFAFAYLGNPVGVPSNVRRVAR